MHRLLSVILLFAASAAAQLHPNGYAAGSHKGLIYFVRPPLLPSSISIGRRYTTGLTMGPRNQELLAANIDGILVRVDPQTHAVLGTIATVPAYPNKIVVGCHGDVYMSTNAAVLRISPTSGAVTTILNGFARFEAGMAIDIDSGDLLVQTRTGMQTLYRVARDGSAITTLGLGFQARFGIDVHIPTGAVYSGACCTTHVLDVLPHGASVATVFFQSPTDPIGVESLRADRASAATQQLVLGTYASTSPTRGTGGVYAIQLANRAVNSLVRTPGASLYSIEILYRRNVHTVRTARGRWDVGVAVPENANLAYVLLAGASGVRPGVALSGGRRLPLNPDGLTLASLRGGLAPWFRGGMGFLDGSGRALATLDLRALGPAATGLRLWFLAVTLSAGSPGGIATITDPTVLVVEGL